MFFGPLAIFLGAADVSVGLLATLPQVAGDLCQLATARLVKAFGSRKTFVLAGVAGQAACLAAAVFLALHPWHGLACLMILSVLYWSCWMVITPAWQSWIGDMVPAGERGRFFGWRSRWIQIATFASLVAGGLILEFYRDRNAAIGFATLMVLALAGRLLSLVFLAFQKDVPEAQGAEDAYRFRDFVKSLRSHNFGRFVLFTALFGLAVNISGSYFVPFVLDELGFGYARFMVLLAFMFGAKFVTMPMWGHLSDKYGSRRLFALSCAFFCLPPLLLLVSRNFVYLFFVQLVGGLAVAGFELTSFNFLLDNTSPKHRTRAASYYQVLTGFGIVTGAVIGGFLLQHAPWGLNSFTAVFLISGVLRLLLWLALMPSIREVRKVPHVTYRELAGRLVRFQKSMAE